MAFVLSVFEYTAKAEPGVNVCLSLEGPASGVYIIQVNTDKGNVARKLEVIK
jgi:hypothetical protein